MAYEKQTWECGETITADKLNHMEDGIANASGGGTEPFLIFKEVSTEFTTEPCPNDASKSIHIATTTYNYSWQEIHDALSADTPVFYAREKRGEYSWRLVSGAYPNDAYDVVLDDGTIISFDSPTAKVTVSRDDSECGGAQ